MKIYKAPQVELIDLYADEDVAAIEMTKSEIVVKDDTVEI